ncbi:hypothetical protein ACN47E_005234 [Coniothyrium glycines]
MLPRPADPWPHSHHDLIQHYYDEYDRGVAAGEIQPFLYPWGTFGALVVIIYLLIPHHNRPWLRNCRYLVFAWITWFAAYCIRYTRARHVAAAFGVGLISAWSVIWVGAILICNDCQTDFMRIERIEGALGSAPAKNNKETYATEHAVAQENSTSETDRQPIDIVSHGQTGPRDRHGPFAWQPYPLHPFIERVDWVLDIFCNFRGSGWNWRTSALPPPPKWVQEQLRQNSGGHIPKHSNKTHPGQLKAYTTRKELLTANLRTLLIGYFTLDLFKTVMMHDPYFWGYVERSPPSTPFLPALVTSSPALTHIYRLTLSMLAIKTALQTVFALGPLFFSGVLGPRYLGARAEPFMYPETWAAYSVVLDRGLAGWWSSWWHQTFRFAFAQPSQQLAQRSGLGPRSAAARVLQLFTAFALSGVVHASGSFTCAGDTRPLRGSLVFFVLQACAIAAELAAGRVLARCRAVRRLPRRARQLATFAYVHLWFYLTAHLLCEEFARGGIWLFEPIPVSVLRGLGLGADERDGWWCWGGELLRWHSDAKWWRSGIAF